MLIRYLVSDYIPFFFSFSLKKNNNKNQKPNTKKNHQNQPPPQKTQPKTWSHYLIQSTERTCSGVNQGGLVEECIAQRPSFLFIEAEDYNRRKTLQVRNILCHVLKHLSLKNCMLASYLLWSFCMMLVKQPITKFSEKTFVIF